MIIPNSMEPLEFPNSSPAHLSSLSFLRKEIDFSLWSLLLFFGSKEGRKQQPATTCQLSSLPPYLSSFLPPHSTVSVLIVGLSYEARNVLSYTRRRMQNFLAFRDSPIIPLRRLPLVPSWTFWFLCFSLFVTTEEDSAFEARHAYPDMMLVSAPWVGDIHRVVRFRFSISTLVQMTQRRGIFG